jgi:hypothetical protein
MCWPPGPSVPLRLINDDPVADVEVKTSAALIKNDEKVPAGDFINNPERFFQHEKFLCQIRVINQSNKSFRNYEGECLCV